MTRREFFKWMPLLPVVGLLSIVEAPESSLLKQPGDSLTAKDWNALVEQVKQRGGCLLAPFGVL